MEGSLLRYVIDANILIDLQNGGLLSQLFSLKAHLYAPDVVIEEISSSFGTLPQKYGLLVEELSGELVTDAMNLRARHRCLSVPDAFALVLAKDIGCPMLTGDRCMKRAAEEVGIPVHGILWCLNSMLQEKTLDYQQAISSLETIMQKNSRLPQAECQKQLKDWREHIHRN
ncbi:hypothetical protein DSECCO2_73150 [anaerobic digester metagenome]